MQIIIFLQGHVNIGEKAMNSIFIVEKESGSSMENGAMIFDSAWSSLDAAEKYCVKFKGMDWTYEISEVKLDSGN